MSIEASAFLPHRRRPASLVTGAAGFLGSHLVDRLLAEGHLVVGLDNLSTGTLHNLDEACRTWGDERFLFVRGDLTGEVVLPSMVYDYVWHLACPASPVDYRRLSVETMMVNSIGTKRMLDISLKHGARFMLAGTSEAYGDPEVHPQPEWYWGHVNPVGVRACYDEGKRFAEALVMEYHRRYGLDARIVRIFNTYGPRMQTGDGRVIPNFIVQALRGEPLTVYGDGSQTRSFVFVRDEVDGLLAAMLSDRTTGEVLNLGNPDEYTIVELAVTVARLCEVPLRTILCPLPPDDPHRRCPDISKAIDLLGWTPVTRLEEGLRATVAYLASFTRGEGAAPGTGG